MGFCQKSDELLYHTKSTGQILGFKKEGLMDHYLGTVFALIGPFVFYQDSNNWLNKSCELVRLNNHKKVKIP